MESVMLNILISIINIVNTFLISKIQHKISESYIKHERYITKMTLKEKKLLYETFLKELDNLTIITKDVKRLKDNYIKKIVEADEHAKSIDSTL